MERNGMVVYSRASRAKKVVSDLCGFQGKSSYSRTILCGSEEKL